MVPPGGFLKLGEDLEIGNQHENMEPFEADYDVLGIPFFFGVWYPGMVSMYVCWNCMCYNISYIRFTYRL